MSSEESDDSVSESDEEEEESDEEEEEENKTEEQDKPEEEDKSEEEEEATELNFEWQKRGMKVGFIVVCEDSDNSQWVGEVKELIEQVWVEGSDMEGDVVLHEYGNTRGTGIKGQQLPKYRTYIPKKRRKPNSKNPVDEYAAAPPSGASPVLVHVWAESVVSSGARDHMLTQQSKLRKQAI